MTVKVIGAGFGRTGTTSLKAALEKLGFGPCEHMSELFGAPERAKLWDRAALRKSRGEPVDWDDLLGGYRSTVDWPGCAFYEELMEAYPDAKVILSVRDPERWYASTLNTIYAVRQTTSSSPIFSLLALLRPGFRYAGRMIDRIIWEGTFSGRFEDRGYSIGVFERHNEGVKRRVPADKLLVYEVKDGWEPLCDFLGVEAPRGEPFPHLNDGGEFRKTVRRLSTLASAAPVVGALLLVIPTLLGLRWYLRH